MIKNKSVVKKKMEIKVKLFYVYASLNFCIKSINVESSEIIVQKNEKTNFIRMKDIYYDAFMQITFH